MTITVDDGRVRSLNTAEEEALGAPAGGENQSSWRVTARRWLPTVVTFAIAPLLVLTWILARQFDLIHPILLPEFSDAVAGLRDVVTAEGFAGHLWRTVSEIGLGFLLGCIVGLALGIGLASFPLLRRAYFPLLAGFEAIPGHRPCPRRHHLARVRALGQGRPGRNRLLLPGLRHHARRPVDGDRQRAEAHAHHEGLALDGHA